MRRAAVASWLIVDIALVACGSDPALPNRAHGPGAGEGSALQGSAAEDAACDSLYAAALAERFGRPCDVRFDAPGPWFAKAALEWAGCSEAETPNACYQRQYADPESEVPLAGGPSPVGPGLRSLHVGKYLPPCPDGLRGPCAEPEIRCIDGTRPIVYAQRGHGVAHQPVESGVWIISMGGEGAPCGGEVGETPYACWEQYMDGGRFGQSLSSRRPWDPPPSAGMQKQGIQRDSTLLASGPNPFHGYNRVFFERCSEYGSVGEEIIHPTLDGETSMPGPTTVYHHGLAITNALFRYLTTATGRDLGDGGGGPPDGDAGDPDDLPSLANATQVLLTGGSDAGKWLIYVVDELAAELQALSPGVEVKVVFDSITDPMLEGEFGHQYPYDPSRDANGNGVNDIYDHITDNPSALKVPHAGPADPPYDARTWEPGGFERTVIDAYAMRLDQSCESAHGPGAPECYDTNHTALNHVATPFMVVMDLEDETVRDSSWDNTANPWATGAYHERVRRLGIDIVEYAAASVPLTGDDPTVAPYTPAVWMPSRGHHTHILTTSRIGLRMYRCSASGRVLAAPSLAGALNRWLSDGTTVDAIEGYSPPGTSHTWHDQVTCDD